MTELITEISTHLWLGCVAVVGSLLGYFRKQYPLDHHKDLTEKVASWLLFMATSMFAAMIVYELSILFVDKINIRVASGGLAAFCGTDVLAVLEKRFIKKIGGE